jgi:hypothetical protein
MLRSELGSSLEGLKISSRKSKIVQTASITGDFKVVHMLKFSSSENGLFSGFGGMKFIGP